MATVISSVNILILISLSIGTIILTQRITQKDPVRLYPQFSSWIATNFSPYLIMLPLIGLIIGKFSQGLTLILWSTIIYIVNLIIPFRSYGYLYKKLPQRPLNFIAQSNIALNALTIGLFISNYSGEVDFIALIEGTTIVLILNLMAHGFLIVIAWIYGLVSGNIHSSSKQVKPRKNMISHYEQLGLSQSEIDIFREYMAEAKEHIDMIEKETNQSARLRTIANKHNTIKVIQGYFKDIVNEAHRQHEASDFLFKYLPNLADLTNKYNEVNSHVAKNKQSYLLLERTSQAIDEVSAQIIQDYVAFHKKTYDQLSEELAYTDRILNQELLNEQENELLSDLIDEDPLNKEDDEFEF